MSLDVSLYMKFEKPQRGGDGVVVWEGNITHNLNDMARHAGVYQAMWRPEEIEATKAWDIYDILMEGLQRLESNPDHFKKYNPTNCWGSYNGLMDFISDYLRACTDYPDAEIRINR